MGHWNPNIQTPKFQTISEPHENKMDEEVLNKIRNDVEAVYC